MLAFTTMRYSDTIDRCETDDVRIRRVEALTPPEVLIDELPSTDAVSELTYTTRASIGRILTGADPRLLVIIGPCSIHHVASALRYAQWAHAMRKRFGDSLLIVMRVYFEKPRTRYGWKGLINDPDLDGSFRIHHGLRLARRLLLDINEMGVPAATEFVDPITPQYIGDLISWAAIGARTTESQVHRELASGLSCPVGFKNNTHGDVGVAIDAIMAARRPHHFLSVTKAGTAATVATTGNQACHVILRGGKQPNYDERSVRAAAEALAAEGLEPRVMVDCSHGNCCGRHREQLAVACEVVRQLGSGSHDICGVMVESNLRAGTQRGASTPPIPEQSITDPCLGLEDSERLLSELAQALARLAV
jgi:3-deoxy-7-phosphoheptulonate synthase